MHTVDAALGGGQPPAIVEGNFPAGTTFSAAIGHTNMGVDCVFNFRVTQVA